MRNIDWKAIEINWGGMNLEVPKEVKKEYEDESINCYPAPDNIFKAFNLCPLNKVKVVIIGQDPYPGAGKANGLAFSTNEMTPDLIHMNEELNANYVINSPDLTSWAKQGVLLMNSYLSVREGEPLSHKNKRKKKYNWDKDVTIKVIKKLNHDDDNPKVFILWGGHAIKFAEKLITNKQHKILKSSHPSNQGYKQELKAAGKQSFFGCNHFEKANEFLQKHGINPINWNT